MARILIADGADLKMTVTWEPIDKMLTEKLEKLGHEVVLQHFEKDELKKRIGSFEIVVVGESTFVDREIIDAAASGKLKAIIKAGTAMKNIDVEYAKGKGIRVENTPECSRNAVCELILGHIVSVSRFFFQCLGTMKNGEWNSYTGIELSNRTLGLIGFDKTAKMLAKKAQALGMTVTYWDEKGPCGSPEYADFKYLDFMDLLASNTFLSLHAQYDPKKGCLLGEKELFHTEKGANLINCCDGRLVDENALLKALGATMAEMHLFGVALDTFQEEPTKNKALLAHDRVSLSPHICHDTYEANTRRAQEILDIINGL
ncbi:MAG: NAD(P)-dependent oxidoreductase [Bacillota bacterium]